MMITHFQVKEDTLVRKYVVRREKNTEVELEFCQGSGGWWFCELPGEGSIVVISPNEGSCCEVVEGRVQFHPFHRKCPEAP